MTISTASEVRERVIRWLEDGQGQMAAILGILNDYERLRGVAEAAERECERLRALQYENERLRNQVEATEHESRALRQEIANLRALAERHVRDREEIAVSLSQLVNDVLLRLRAEQP
jgi:predicted RNase H-like nuclease (RuvC/YqgF family)